jgi:hypothetical protein
VPERVGQVLPQQVLEFVYECEEPRSQQGGRNPDQGAEDDEAEVGAAPGRAAARLVYRSTARGRRLATIIATTVTR